MEEDALTLDRGKENRLIINGLEVHQFLQGGEATIALGHNQSRRRNECHKIRPKLSPREIRKGVVYRKSATDVKRIVEHEFYMMNKLGIELFPYVADAHVIEDLNGSMCIVMDLSGDDSLPETVPAFRDIARNLENYDFRDRLAYFQASLRAHLEFHRRGVVQHDNSDGNTLALNFSDGRKVSRVVDFGFSIELEELETLDPEKPDSFLVDRIMSIGTPGYSSPERLITYLSVYSPGLLDFYETIARQITKHRDLDDIMLEIERSPEAFARALSSEQDDRKLVEELKKWKRNPRIPINRDLYAAGVLGKQLLLGRDEVTQVAPAHNGFFNELYSELERTGRIQDDGNYRISILAFSYLIAQKNFFHRRKRKNYTIVGEQDRHLRYAEPWLNRLMSPDPEQAIKGM